MLVLFPDEQVLQQFSDGSVTLTTHRILQEHSKSKHQSIMLENIIACEAKRLSYYLLPVAGIVVALLAIQGVNKNTGDLQTAVAIPIIGSVLLFLTIRPTVIIISSSSIKIEINASKMKKEQIDSFINGVEGAKQKRIDLLK